MSLLNIGGLGNITSALIGGTSCIPDLSQYGFSAYGGYRPPQWNSSFLGTEDLVYCKTNIGGLFFDAVISVDTDHTSTVTSYPVQSGANMSDHMYENPVTITMEIAMSDAMDSMVHGQWHNAGEKGVSAYRTLRDLQKSRIPIDVLTRLDRYQNMVIQSIHVNDDSKTLGGLKASVHLQQIITATVSTEKVSARNWTSGGANRRGEIQVEEQGSVISEIMDDGEKGLKDKV